MRLGFHKKRKKCIIRRIIYQFNELWESQVNFQKLIYSLVFRVNFKECHTR